MNEPKTITRGAGQDRRSAARLILTVAKYAALTLAGIILFRAGAAYALTLAGIILFRAGAAYALTVRGYSAVGGEAFALFLPAFYALLSGVGRGYVKDTKNGYLPDYKEDNEQ